MVIEGENGKMVLYKTKIGFVVIFGNKNVNLGLARVTLDEAADQVDSMQNMWGPGRGSGPPVKCA